MRASINEYKAVELAAQKFAEGVGKGKSEIAKPAFYKNAVMFGFLDGKLEEGPIQNLYDNIDQMGADPAYVARVDVLDVEQTVAVARVIEDEWGGHDFTDYLMLLKIDGEWQVVAKVYNQNSQQ